MGTRRPARLYQKKSGLYFVRVLLADSFDHSQKSECKRSLRTKDLTFARRMASVLNASLEGAPMNGRVSIVNDFFHHTVSTWTLPGGISCDDDDDQARLERFLAKHPRIEKAVAKCIARTAAAPAHRAAAAPPVPAHATSRTGDAEVRAVVAPEPQRPPLAAPTSDLQRDHAVADSRLHVAPATTATAPLPKRPTRLSEARILYNKHYNDTLEAQNDRTTDDKGRNLDMFVEYLHANHPELGDDPWVHEIDSSHLNGFLAEQSQRPGKRVDRDGKAMRAAPRTLIKKLGDVTHVFKYLKTIVKATQEDLAEDTAEASEIWRNRAKVEDVHYEPFTNDHIRRIFEPSAYLARSRDPDHFWGPLLGLHFGARLGEFVNAKLENIGYIPEIDTWYIDVSDAKNANSVRRLPITQPLIGLGFLKYVEHVRRLGAVYLFPHRDWTCPTAIRDRSKAQSDRFGKYLDAIGIQAPYLVFHSFRHTVVSVMQDAGVPMSIAMQIAGHEAQDHAVRTGLITEQQARSVHQSVYTHADLERMGTDYPILKLKEALDKSIKPPIDYPRLSMAAEIVLEHTRKVGGRFRTGWPPQRQRYTDEMTARLATVTATSAQRAGLTVQPAPTEPGPVTTTFMERTVGTVGTVGRQLANCGE